MNFGNGMKQRLSGQFGRSASSESISSVYLSCSSIAGDERSPPSSVSLYKSFSSCSPTKPLSWRKSMLALADAVVSEEKVVPVGPPPKCYQVDYQGSEISLITCGPGDVLITIHRRLPSDGKKEGILRRPIVMFKSAVNWKYAARVMMNDLAKDGVYFVGICWKLKRSYQCEDGITLEKNEPYILHCICKEPQKRFQGRVGPISTYVPQHEPLSNKRIGGIWVSLFSDQIYAEFIDQLTPFEPEYRRQLKAVDGQCDQMMFFVSNEAACVGIQVLNTKREEKQIKQSKQVYHHERPLILEDGFYLVEGIFETNFLNDKLGHKKLQLDCSSGPKIIVLGEGTHLIRTQTEPTVDWFAKRQTKGHRKASNSCKSTPDDSNKSSFGSLSMANSDNSALLSSGSQTKSNKSNSPRSGTTGNPPPKHDSARLCAKVSKIRKIEVCLDCRYDRLIALDHSVLQQDFEFKIDSN